MSLFDDALKKSREDLDFHLRMEGEEADFRTWNGWVDVRDVLSGLEVARAADTAGVREAEKVGIMAEEQDQG